MVHELASTWFPVQLWLPFSQLPLCVESIRRILWRCVFLQTSVRFPSRIFLQWIRLCCLTLSNTELSSKHSNLLFLSITKTDQQCEFFVIVSKPCCEAILSKTAMESCIHFPKPPWQDRCLTSKAKQASKVATDRIHSHLTCLQSQLRTACHLSQIKSGSIEPDRKGLE